ncbi:MAG: DUF192 domain-containing protein [Acidimicrobiia bacterium]
MSRGAWLAVVAPGLLVIAGVALVAFANDSDDEDPASPPGPVAVALDEAEPASKPFEGLTQATVQVGDATLDVVLADESDERSEGLRERSDIGRYDGMLFVFPSPTQTAFTMSTVPVPLDIGFFDEQGKVVDRLKMLPCPEPESGCPTYSASGPFSYALETLADDLPRGPLGAPAT